MFLIDQIMLIAGVLIMLGIASSKLSTRIGVPGLVLFMLIGMLAGSEGIGGIDFEQYEFAHAIGSLALAVILFDGGLQTSFESVRMAWKPSGFLATVGVLATAFLTASAAVFLLGLPWLQALLLGSIISSTDAAAVFSILRKQGVRLESRLASTLEMESGANDPMAIFLTVTFIELIIGNVEPGVGVLWLFVLQMGLGSVLGLLGGWLGARVINRINLDSPGLYPVLATSLGLTIFGVTSALGGSGFLAIYLAGICFGNQRLVFQRAIFQFHDAAAWTGQIVMFTLLGMLVFPSQLLDVTLEGLLVALALTFVVRPLVVFTSMPFFGFNLRELTLLSWVGLKGAVPIILGVYPLLFGVPNGRAVFDVVFFVVLFSATAQGWSLPLVARKLGLNLPMPPAPSVFLELNALQHVDADIVEYLVTDRAPACGKALHALPLPDEIHISLVARAQQIVPPRGHTVVRQGDYLFVVQPAESRALMDRIFGGGAPADLDDWPERIEFIFAGSVTAADLEHFYGVELPGDDRAMTLAELLTAGQPPTFEEGAASVLDRWTLTARKVGPYGVEKVGLTLNPLPAGVAAISRQPSAVS